MLERQDVGTLELNCQAPPYPIVQACNAVGIERPEDVGWVNMDLYLGEQQGSVWEKLLRPQESKDQHLCTCKEPVPKLAKYRFTYSSGDEVTYSVGQCIKCKKVYWAEG